jgi:diadenylate cyclase
MKLNTKQIWYGLGFIALLFIGYFWRTEIIHIGFLSIRVYDFVDIIAVAAVLYKMYLIFEGTRAAQMMIGMLILFLLSVLVRALELNGMTWLMSNLSTVWVIAFVIIFQPEMRRMLIHIGQIPLVKYLLKVEGIHAIDNIIDGMKACQAKRWGALIVLEREVGLRNLKEKAIAVNAPVSAELLVSIFNPTSPMHDGAVIINDDMIDVAKAILPLSEEPSGFRMKIGTRHLAAIGLSEETDALILVVSEETGTMSYANNGVMKRGLDEIQLRQILNKYLE